MFGISNTNYGKNDYNRLRSSQEEINHQIQHPLESLQINNQEQKTDGSVIDTHINYISQISKDPHVRYNNFIRYIKKDAAPSGK
jgi:hypothetical protein